MERVGGETVWKGHIGSVRVDRFRYDDGEEADREIVAHPGAVAVLAHDGKRLFMVRQPREPVNEPDLLELPAGKLDEEGESPLETAQRELAEEIGKGARDWKHLKTFYTSPGFTDEVCHVYEATDLYDQSAEADENERIEVVDFPLDDLDAVIGECKDAKSLIALLWFRAHRS
jgi:ADP-ribose pyrophosphatase